jgi:Arc/MetJ-type ribon-helix-helix transcriptional regulator
MVSSVRPKKDFATRLSPHVLAQLDELVRRGRFRNRTVAIEAAVQRLYQADEEEFERKRRAFERGCGALSLGIDREGWLRAEEDRLEWETERVMGRFRRR